MSKQSELIEKLKQLGEAKASYLHKNYFPELSPQKIGQILSMHPNAKKNGETNGKVRWEYDETIGDNSPSDWRYCKECEAAVPKLQYDENAGKCESCKNSDKVWVGGEVHILKDEDTTLCGLKNKTRFTNNTMVERFVETDKKATCKTCLKIEEKNE